MIEVHIHYRVATPGDAAGIWSVLSEVAPEIPLLIDTSERQEALSTIINDRIAAEVSWVATNGAGVVAGFILAEPDKMVRSQNFNHGDDQAIHLSYAGVSKTCRRQGIFDTLIKQVMRQGVPLTATVKAGNQCGMAELLLSIGFQTLSKDPQNEDLFKWSPEMILAL